MSEKKRRGPPDKVRLSRYRKSIDEMITDGVTPVNISAWLKEQDPPESIGKTAIYDYINNIFDVEDEAVQQYSDLKSQERLKEAGKKRASELEKLDTFADMALDLKLDLNITVDERTSVLDIEKHKLNVKRAGVQAKKIVLDFLKGAEPEKDLNVNIGMSVHDQIREFEEYYRRLEEESEGTD